MMILRKHVERIVRPLRAATSRKNRIREELLAHLTDLVDDAGSVEAAIQRFGDPSALRADLQASVPAIERILAAPVPLLSRAERRPGESVLAHTRRVAPTLVAFAFVVSLLQTLVVLFTRNPNGGGSMSWFVALDVVEVAIFPGIGFGTWLLADVMRRSPRAKITALVAHTALYTTSALVIAVMANRAMAFPLPPFVTWAFIAYAAIGSVPLVMRQASDHRRFDAWRGLDLDVA